MTLPASDITVGGTSRSEPRSGNTSTLQAELHVTWDENNRNSSDTVSLDWTFNVPPVSFLSVYHALVVSSCSLTAAPDILS